MRTASVEDVLYVGEHLKEDDLSELTALGDDAQPDRLRLAHKVSHKVFALGPEGAPIAVFGVTPDWAAGVGYVWSLSTPEVLPKWREVHRMTPAILDELGSDFRILTNIKDTRHRHHIRWLRSLGFTFISTVPVGPNNLPCHEFVRIQK